MKDAANSLVPKPQRERAAEKLVRDTLGQPTGAVVVMATCKCYSAACF